MSTLLHNHSKIIDYPIDYDLYPNMKNIKFIEFNINKNDYLLIPNGWIHWVISDPYTFAISFEINNFNKNDSILFSKYENNEPHFDKSKDNNFDYNLFMMNNINKKFKILYSQTDDCSPVVKNNTIKYFKEDTMENAIIEANNKNYYLFIGQNSISNCTNNSIKLINDYIHNLDETNINYETHLWFSLHKKIHSGMHYDERSKILYVLEGRKKVFLLPPSSKKYIYIENLKLINTFSNINKPNIIVKSQETTNTKLYIIFLNFIGIITYFKFEVIICMMIIIFRKYYSKLF